MQALKKHGQNYKLIQLAVKTRNYDQIVGRLRNLLCGVKAGRHHPDRNIIRKLDFSQSGPEFWKPKEIDAFVAAFKQHGTDYKMISKVVKTKNAAQCQKKAYVLKREVETNPKYKHAKVLKNLSVQKQRKWTEKDNTRLIKALQQHGKDYSKLMKIFPDESLIKLRHRVYCLRQEIKAERNHPSKHLKETVEKRSSLWSNKEEAIFVKMVKISGKNYTKIAGAIPTKTREQVRNYGQYLYTKIVKHPKHKHAALKSKLKPAWVPVIWTEAERKLMLKGLKKYAASERWVKYTSVLLKSKTII